VDEIVRRVQRGLEIGITEVHMVGGLHPSLKPEWYIELITRLRALSPALFIKAFTAVESRHLALRVFKKSIRETLTILRDAGLNAITGGGAEIFDQSVRDQICKGKETAEEWAEVHRTWHEMGMHSTATMLFGHIETLEQRVDHLRRLRELQDQTGGFTGFVPFAFESEGARPELKHIQHATAFEELKNLAVSRIYLDNFDHITAYWVSLGLPLASLAMNYGVDDLHGTIIDEKIFHMAGATTPTQQSVDALTKAIREAGRIPMQRDTWYRRIENTWQKPAPKPLATEPELAGA
jgi:aminodeoxyfutalosine synthase